ncbi:apolipoprotein D-like [Malaya genurostris]|uniref:apolipoprotein D-like n=1 Tax=Malaya genurostris TaxID=325434 RepID=UPI0026F3E0B4|nr:apolipoprotein D-like [Malaya genurostris]
MGYQLLFALVLTLSSSSLAQVISSGECPEHPVVQNFNVQSYVGRWYEISRYETSTQRGGECVEVSYTQTSDTSLSLENRLVVPPNTEFEVVNGQSFVSFPNESPVQGRMNISFGAMPPTSVNYWVLDTDYTSFSFVWNCFAVSETLKGENFWLMSRTVELPASAQSRVDELINLYLKPQYIRPTRHDLEGCANQRNAKIGEQSEFDDV